jgi:hypothetical protein
MIMFLQNLVRKRNVSDRRCKENQNTYFMFKNLSGNRAFLGDNVEKYVKSQAGHRLH